MKSSDLIAHQIKKVVVIGPECTGKSELTKFLGDHFKTAHVEEYARAYLNKLIRGYEKSDLTKIAHGQARMEDEWVYDANRVLICDTNAIVINFKKKFFSCVSCRNIHNWWNIFLFEFNCIYYKITKN